MITNKLIISTSFILLILLSSCQLNMMTPTATPQTRLITPTSIAIQPAMPPQLPTATPSDEPITLTLWTVEAVSDRSSQPQQDFIIQGLNSFRTTNLNTEVEVIVKKPNGKGGIIDYLRTAKAVAPVILPDVAIVDAADLKQIYEEQLIVPLDGLLSEPTDQDLLPAARKMGTVIVQEQDEGAEENEERARERPVLVGVPLGLALQHVLVNTRTVTNTTILWRDIITQQNRYLFPVGGLNGVVNDATLAQYFSLGGRVFDEAGKAKIDEPILREMLEIYATALATNVIDSSLLNATNPADLWPRYLEEQVDIVQITVSQYLAVQDSLTNSSFAAIPVRNSADIPMTITRGWVFVLVTADPARQAQAISLIEWFLDTGNNAVWNDINQTIPSRESAYQQLALTDNTPYWEFLAVQLDSAQPQPSSTEFDQVGRIMQQAVEQVISGQSTPEEATATAIDALP